MLWHSTNACLFFAIDNEIYIYLTHWGRGTHICVCKLTIIGSDNGLSPDRCQAIIWTNARLLSIGPLETNFSEILIEILTFSFKKMRLKVSSAKRHFFLGLNVLIHVMNPDRFSLTNVRNPNRFSEGGGWGFSKLVCPMWAGPFIFLWPLPGVSE